MISNTKPRAAILSLALLCAAVAVAGAAADTEECPGLREALAVAARAARGGKQISPAEAQRLTVRKLQLFSALSFAQSEEQREDIRREMKEVARTLEEGASSSPYGALTPDDIENVSCDELRALAEPAIREYGDWEDWRRRQSAAPGEDGFIGIARPFSDAQSGAAHLMTGVKFYFINGLDNTYAEASNSAQKISNQLNAPVVHVYSASHRQDDTRFPMARDVTEAAAYRLGAGSAAHDALYESIARDLRAGRTVRVFAHSRGAAVTYNTVGRLQRELERDGLSDRMSHLTVVTLGGFAPRARDWPSPARVIDVQNERDVVPWLWSADTGRRHGNFSVSQHAVSEYAPWVKKLGGDELDPRLFGTDIVFYRDER